MPRRLISLSILALAMLLTSGAAYAAAPVQQGNPLTLELRAGFDGYLQNNTWVPLTITASNTGQGVDGELRVVIEGFTGSGRVIYTRPINLPQGSRKQVTLYPADMGGFGNQVQVDLISKGRTVASSPPTRVQFISAETLLVGLLSDAPDSLADIGEVKPSTGETRVAILTTDDLPDAGIGWVSLDVLVIADADTGQLSDLQRTALRDWVTGGGRLIIVGGPGFQRTLAGLQGVSPLLGQTAQDVSVLPLTTAAGEPLDQQANADALVTTGIVADDASVLVSSEDVPLLITHAIGYGRVDFLAADPALEPLRSWPALDDLWLMILSTGEVRPGWAFGFNTNNWQTAHDATASVPGVRLPSVLQLCGFLGFYVLLIGPVNYFVLSRLKRRELAWVTIPALVILFSAIAYITGFQLRGSQVIVHRLSVVHSWEGSDVSKVQSLVGIWSPRRSRYDITLEPGFFGRPMPQGMGGGLTAPVDSVMDQGEPVTLRRVQVDVGSVQPFVVEGFDENPIQIQSHLAVESEDGSVQITGDILNASDFDLEHAVLIVAGTARKLNTLKAGEVAQINITLNEGQALPAGGLPFDPTPNLGPYGGYYYPYYYDPTIMELADVDDDCSVNADAKRRCDLLQTIMTAQWRGSGIVLAGWADQSPIDMDVLNGNVRTLDETLFFVQLDASATNNSQATGVISPGLMTWQLLSDPNTTGYVSSPYDFYLSSYASPLIFHFQPIRLPSIPQITVIEVHVESFYDATGTPPRVSALNVDTGAWDRLDIDWGTTRIPDAEKYIDAAGGVTLRISSNSGEHNISRFDVTMLEE